MANLQFINGNVYSYVDMNLMLNGIPQPSGVIMALNYKASQPAPYVQGNQVAPVGRTAGYGTATGGFTMLATEFDIFVLTLLASQQNAPPSIMNVDFDIVVTYSNGGLPRVDTLSSCRITDVNPDVAKGDAPITFTCTLSIMNILFNGTAAFSIGDSNPAIIP